MIILLRFAITGNFDYPTVIRIFAVVLFIS
jgi:hypothetical protein